MVTHTVPSVMRHYETRPLWECGDQRYCLRVGLAIISGKVLKPYVSTCSVCAVCC